MATIGIPRVPSIGDLPDIRDIRSTKYDPNWPERQTEIARLRTVGANEDAINQVRFEPLEFDPAKPILCFGNKPDIITERLIREDTFNLDFSCPPEDEGNLFSVGGDIGTFVDTFDEESQEVLDQIEAQINRTDEELEEFRDEARELISPAFKFLKFIGFAIIAFVVLILIFLVTRIIRR